MRHNLPLPDDVHHPQLPGQTIQDKKAGLRSAHPWVCSQVREREDRNIYHSCPQQYISPLGTVIVKGWLQWSSCSCLELQPSGAWLSTSPQLAPTVRHRGLSSVDPLALPRLLDFFPEGVWLGSNTQSSSTHSAEGWGPSVTEANTVL